MVDEKSHQYALSCGYADDDFCGDDTADSIGGHNDSRDRKVTAAVGSKVEIPITLKGVPSKGMANCDFVLVMIQMCWK